MVTPLVPSRSWPLGSTVLRPGVFICGNVKAEVLCSVSSIAVCGAVSPAAACMYQSIACITILCIASAAQKSVLAAACLTRPHRPAGAQPLLMMAIVSFSYVIISVPPNHVRHMQDMSLAC